MIPTERKICRKKPFLIDFRPAPVLNKRRLMDEWWCRAQAGALLLDSRA
jgi:hypothetical protein